MRAFTFATILAAALAGGCYGTTYDVGYGVGYSATVSNVGYAPDLVYVAPGVQVIADYNESIFFHDGFYWRFYGNTWYRSSDYTGGWVYAAPPSALLRIERPHTYVHYRPHGYVPRRERPIIRDHRYEPRPEPRRESPRPAPPPPPRDHRDRDHRERDHREHRTG